MRRRRVGIPVFQLEFATTAMLGVISGPTEESAVREFFELFKIPWEFYRNERQYQVVLCTGDAKPEPYSTRLLILYASEETEFDVRLKIQSSLHDHETHLSLSAGSLPLYGCHATFLHRGTKVLSSENPRKTVGFVDRWQDQLFARVGYDLFREVQCLLTRGQPPANAGIPTLELHIAFLRDLIVGCGIPLVEIPPVPDGYPFIVCLTHDVDHASIRRHKFDHTMFGFLYRATLGSLFNVVRGRLPWRKMFTNWAAAAKLPFIYFGIAKDIWLQFDRYVEIEKGNPSTFFVLPFEGDPGRSSEGRAPRARASRYDASHIASEIPRLTSAGCEIGLHGIDAWLDSSKGREEAKRIMRFSGKEAAGVRMHWLYWSEDSPVILEDGGFAYDSTVGYNDAIGYRAGTSQVYKPLQASRILELPLHVMDTALFYPNRLDLSPGEARKRVSSILDNAARLGGVVTINWHDRSIAPERLWDDFYVELLNDLETRGAWFVTATQAVSWFRKRRSAIFEEVQFDSGALHVKVSTSGGDKLAGLRLRIHKPRGSKRFAECADNQPTGHVDISLNERIDALVAL
jgi:hypothetical protein